VLNLIQSMKSVSKNDRGILKKLVSEHNYFLICIAETYIFLKDLRDMKQSVRILLTHIVKNDMPRLGSMNSSELPESFEKILTVMEKKGEINGMEKNKLINLYIEGDKRITAIWDSYTYDNNRLEFTESIFLFSLAISLNETANNTLVRRRSSKSKNRVNHEFLGNAMDSVSEEFEEEEEEEEEEMENQEAYINDEGDSNVNDDKVRSTFIEQQHRIIKRFCCNAKIPVADGAKFHQEINECNTMLIGCFEVFAMNRNEEDFLENLTVVADLLKQSNDTESPDGKNSINFIDFSASPSRIHEDEPEKKLFDLEPTGKESDDEDDESDGIDIIVPIGTQIDARTSNEAEEYSTILNEFKDQFSDEDFAKLQQVFIEGSSANLSHHAKQLVYSTLETYKSLDDKEEAVDTLKIYLRTVQ